MFFLCFLMIPLHIQAADAATSDEAEKVVIPHFVEFDTITLPLISDGKKPKTLMVNVTAEVATEEDVEHVKNNIPKIKDAFIRVLYKGFQEKTMISANGLLDIELIKDHLVGASNHVLKEGEVKGILVKDIIIQ